MIGITILAISFVAAVVGFFQSNRAESGKTFLFGLTRTGATLVLLATIGFIFGVVKEIQGSKNTAKRTQMLEELSKDVKELAQRTIDQPAAQAFSKIGNRIEAIATHAPESVLSRSDFRASLLDESNFDSSVFKRSNFAKSDFSGANFALSMFRGANFSGGIFHQAEFQGADLSRIVIDNLTKLPPPCGEPNDANSTDAGSRAAE